MTVEGGLRLGMVGAGFIAGFHAGMLSGGDADYAWAGVFDADPQRARAFTERWGGTAAGSVDEVLEGCDAVYVCTWTAEHGQVVDAACERGLPVFCEKPLAVDLAGAEAMAGAVARAGVVNQVGLVLRYSPAFTLARRLVDDSAAGRVMSVVFRDDQFIPVHGLYESDWRADRARAGSGALLEHSIHDLDLLEWLLGPVTEISATTANFHGHDGIEDAAAVTLRYAGGAVGSLVSVWHDVLERPSLRRVEVICERMFLTVEGDWFGPVRWQVSGSDEQVLDGNDLLDAVAADLPGGGNPDAEFVKAAASGRPASPDFADALRAHVLVDAVYRSAARGAPVRV